MPYAVDHIIHYVNDPDRLIEEGRRVGLYAVKGGRHETRGTYNTLAHFNFGYVEWIGVYDWDLARKNRVPHSVIDRIIRSGRREGIVHLALRTSDIAGDVERFRQAGVTTVGPIHGQRRRPDGTLVTWRQLYLYDSTNDIELPFLIQWDRAEQPERETSLNPSVYGLIVRVNDLALADEWAKLFLWGKKDNFNAKTYQKDQMTLNSGNLLITFVKNKAVEPMNQNVAAIVWQGAEHRLPGSFHGVTLKSKNGEE
ncbi:MAG: VOC family protein [Sporolactobacillus sp.]|jgi:hypothetical protein|nr:VOC family protein [Sporolactobacillus sp.]